MSLLPRGLSLPQNQRRILFAVAAVGIALPLGTTGFFEQLEVEKEGLP